MSNDQAYEVRQQCVLCTRGSVFGFANVLLTSYIL